MRAAREGAVAVQVRHRLANGRYEQVLLKKGTESMSFVDSIVY